MDQNNTSITVLKSSLLALLAFISLSLIFIILLPPAIMLLKDPLPLISFFGTGILFLSSFAGGIISSCFSKNPFFSLIPSTIAILILLSGPLFFKESCISFGAALVQYFAVPILFLLGAFAAFALSNKRPKRRKRR